MTRKFLFNLIGVVLLIFLGYMFFEGVAQGRFDYLLVGGFGVVAWISALLYDKRK